MLQVEKGGLKFGSVQTSRLTKLPTDEGWLFLAVVIYLSSR
jgi:hypothetical protein